MPQVTRQHFASQDTFDTVINGDMESSFETDAASLNECGSNGSEKTSLEEQNSALQSQLTQTLSELEYWKYKAMKLERKNPKAKIKRTAAPPSSLREAAQRQGGVWKQGLDGLWKITNPQKPNLKPKHIFRNSNVDSEGFSVELSNRRLESGLHNRRSVHDKAARAHFTSSDEDDDVVFAFDENTGEKNALIKTRASDYDENSTTATDDSHEQTFFQALADRGGWLVGLLVVQSLSSFILKSNENLLQRHAVIVRFLTMLVGAGGNAGNQASVRVIRGLATGRMDDENRNAYLREELRTGFFLSLLLGAAGCIRAAIFFTPLAETLAITASLFMIVSISIFLGTMLPLLMEALSIDPAHSSTSIQGRFYVFEE